VLQYLTPKKSQTRPTFSRTYRTNRQLIRDPPRKHPWAPPVLSGPPGWHWAMGHGWMARCRRTCTGHVACMCALPTTWRRQVRATVTLHPTATSTSTKRDRGRERTEERPRTAACADTHTATCTSEFGNKWIGGCACSLVGGQGM